MKRILIVAPRIPRYDMTAGDWRVFSLGVMLTRFYRVSLLPLSIELGDSEYIDEIEKSGMEIVYPFHRGLDDLRQFIILHKFEKIIIEWFYTAVPLLRLLCSLSDKTEVVIDTHELQYLKTKRSPGMLGKVSDIESSRNAELAIYRTADTLIAITETEKRILRQVFPRKKIVVLPTCVTVPEKYQGGFECRNDMVFFASFIGGLSNPNYSAVLYFMKTIFPLIVKELPGARLHVLGSGAAAMPHPSILKQEKITDISGELRKYRVFVCPLRYGAGMKKKLLDAASAGTPIVTTSVGADGMRFRNKRDVLIADAPKDFAKAVITLYRNVSQWERLSKNAYSLVKKYYDQRFFEKNVIELMK